MRQLHPAAVDARGRRRGSARRNRATACSSRCSARTSATPTSCSGSTVDSGCANVGDERPFSTLRRSVEHEALIALKARDVGVRTPHLLTVATVEPNGFLLAYATVDGASLDRVRQPWSDDLLRGIWEQVALLRRERIAHRDLRRANLFVDADGVPWVIDFGFSELAVSDDRCSPRTWRSSSLRWRSASDPDRAVDSAIHGIGPETVGTALPYLQLPAFAGATRQALKEKKGLLEQVRNTVSDAPERPKCNTSR